MLSSVIGFEAHWIEHSPIVSAPDLVEEEMTFNSCS